MVTQFWSCIGRFERCNYINNSQNIEGWGIIYVSFNMLKIFDSSFQNNRQNRVGALFIYFDVVLALIHLMEMFIHQIKDMFH